MVRKKRTDGSSGGAGESSHSQEGGGSARGPQQPSERSVSFQEGQGGGGYCGGRGGDPQGQQGGRGGGGPGGMPQQQQYGVYPEYQGRGKGGPPQQGGRGTPSGGPSRPPAPELLQATPAPFQAVVNQPGPYEASSSSGPPEPSAVQQQMEQLSLQREGSSSQAIQTLPPPLSKSMRFPLRPGKGSTGIKCIVKANHFFAELPDKDLHQYDLKYHDAGREKDCLPQVGQWNMKNKKMVNGGTVHSWFCINFSRNVKESVATTFCSELAQMCCISGMQFNPEPVLPPYSARPEQVEKVLKTRYHDAMTKLHGRELDLLIVILPDKNGSLYGDLKRMCDTDLGLVSVCCLTKHVFEMSKQYLANVALKINVKVGGRNTVLVDALSGRIPLVSDLPTIIFGADVTHPHPGEDSSPSIAAVVASQDWPEVTKYAGLVCAQAHRQELIQDLYKTWQDPVRGPVSGGMIKELLMSFYRATGQKPQRIIFYRDGVSECQFYQVLLYELDAIRKACASVEPNYQPPVTFVVVQKRHHTRLFANNHNDRDAVDRSGNILPGTVLDSKICHPTEFDFYLCSHAGIQGTSRPAHYHVLWDENNFTADGFQSLTNNLCYTYARCTRSVSIVPPAYYAHLAAFRARFYMEPETSDSGSMTSGTAAGRGMDGGAGSTRGPGAVAAVRPLPALRENVMRVMFYC